MLLELVVVLVMLLLALLVLHVLLVRTVGWGLRRRTRVLLRPVAHGGSAVLGPASFSPAAREAADRTHGLATVDRSRLRALGGRQRRRGRRLLFPGRPRSRQTYGLAPVGRSCLCALSGYQRRRGRWRRSCRRGCRRRAAAAAPAGLGP